MNRKNFGPSVNCETWNSFSDQDKEAWNMISPSARKSIFDYAMKSGKFHENKPSNNKSKNNSFGVNLHQAENPDNKNLEDEHTHHHSDDVDNDVNNEIDLLVNMAKHGLPPGNINRLLSGSSNEKNKSKSNIPTKLIPKNNDKKNLSQEVSLTYSITKSKSSITKGSLIDRGANGGVAGSDA